MSGSHCGGSPCPCPPLVLGIPRAMSWSHCGDPHSHILVPLWGWRGATPVGFGVEVGAGMRRGSHGAMSRTQPCPGPAQRDELMALPLPAAPGAGRAQQGQGPTMAQDRGTEAPAAPLSLPGPSSASPSGASPSSPGSRLCARGCAGSGPAASERSAGSAAKSAAPGAGRGAGPGLGPTPPARLLASSQPR